MTWKDALIKLENTINTYNFEIQSLKNEKYKLEDALKKLKEEARPSLWKKVYNKENHNKVFINQDGNILLYDHNVKMASFYELHHREFMFDIDNETYAPIEKAYSYGELLRLAKTCDIECKKVYELKKEKNEIQFKLNERNEKFNILAKEFNELVKENSLCKEQNKELYDTIDTIRKILKNGNRMIFQLMIL